MGHCCRTCSKHNIEILFDAWFVNARRKCASRFVCVHVRERVILSNYTGTATKQSFVCKDCYHWPKVGRYIVSMGLPIVGRAFSASCFG